MQISVTLGFKYFNDFVMRLVVDFLKQPALAKHVYQLFFVPGSVQFHLSEKQIAFSDPIQQVSQKFGELLAKQNISPRLGVREQIALLKAGMPIHTIWAYVGDQNCPIESEAELVFLLKTMQQHSCISQFYGELCRTRDEKLKEFLDSLDSTVCVSCGRPPLATHNHRCLFSAFNLQEADAKPGVAPTIVPTILNHPFLNSLNSFFVTTPQQKAFFCRVIFLI